MSETAVPAVDFSADADLIGFLKAVPDARYSRGARHLMLPAAHHGARDEQRLQELPRSEGLRQAASGSTDRGLGPELQALAVRCHLPLPVQQGAPAAVRRGAAGLVDQPDPRWS